MIMVLKHKGQELSRGSDLGCQYAMQRLCSTPIETALESGDWTITPAEPMTGTVIITKQSKLNGCTITREEPRRW